MNIASNEDSGFDLTGSVLNDEQIHINFRFNKDNCKDVNISYIFTKEEVIALRDALTDLIGE
jgi:hypothetical protein